jgi:hypothetical protein
MPHGVKNSLNFQAEGSSKLVAVEGLARDMGRRACEFRFAGSEPGSSACVGIE